MREGRLDEYVNTVHAAHFPLNNKLNTEQKWQQWENSSKKASDHIDVDMFEPALQYGTSVTSCLFI